MKLKEAEKLLAENGQTHLLKFYDTLGPAEQKALLAQIAAIDFGIVKRETVPYAPARVDVLAGAGLAAAEKAGEAELAAGKVAALLVAGGQGSRLGYEYAKGSFGIGPVSNAPLFYFHARKLLALKLRYGKPVPLYIMTSEDNDAQTRAFFAAHGNFGLDASDVFFFIQPMWPAFTGDGKIILESPGRISMAPNGHGGTIGALETSGGIADMSRRGIETVFFFQVDNPLVDICSPPCIGYHKLQNADVTVKVCEKAGSREKVGMPVELNGKTLIVEYTEFTESQQDEKTAAGELRFKYGSVNILVFSLPFLKREASANLPIHTAHKTIGTVDAAGAPFKPEKPNGYKAERFIFDTLADAQITRCLAFDRADEFAPVKNKDDNKAVPPVSDTPSTCKAALTAKWRRWLEAAGTKPAPGAVIEIDPVFADSPKALAEKLKTAKLRPDPDAKSIFLR